jgi:membrane fusion protein, adhesin transport system
MSERLYQSGDISNSEVMRAQRQVLELQARLQETRSKVFQEIRNEIAKLEDELSASQHKLAERKNVLEHTKLIAPMDGVVKYVRITTVGGVLKPGDELMQISPVDDELLAEIKVNPADVGDLKPGLPVSLRFDAFDSSIYGSLQGTLRYISPDTLSEPGDNGQTQVYYRGLVTIQWPTVEAQGERRIRPQDIKPGMTATADLLTGKRTILFYLAKPIVRAFSGALTER